MADLSKELSKELNKDFAYCEDALGRAENAIGNLPSVQPEKRTEERMETHACDLIDREAAIDEIMGQPTELHYPSWYAERIRQMPAAPPKVVAEIKIDGEALQKAVDEAVEHIKAELFGKSEQLRHHKQAGGD